MLVIEAADKRYSHEGGEENLQLDFKIIGLYCEKLFPRTIDRSLQRS